MIDAVALLIENIAFRWHEWRVRRRQYREGQVIDIRTTFKEKGLP